MNATATNGSVATGSDTNPRFAPLTAAPREFAALGATADRELGHSRFQLRTFDQELGQRPLVG